MPHLTERVLGAPTPLRALDLLPPDQPLKPFPPVRRWRYNAGVRALVFAVVFVLVTLLLALATGAALALAVGDPQRSNALLQRYAMVLAIPASLVAYGVLGRWWEGRRPVHELALRRAPAGLAVGLGLGAVFMLGSVGLLALLGAYRVHGFDPTYDPWPALISAGFVAGIVEEILFRGILYRLLEDTFGTWAAVGLSGLAFGVAHITNPHATWQGALGIALEAGLLFAALYAFTRSLWVVIGVHFAWNVVQGPVLGIVVSGSSSQGSGFIRSTLTGPEWLSGGGFGAEASLVTIAALTAVAIWLLVEIHRRGLVVAPTWVRRRRLSASVPATREPSTQQIMKNGN